MTPSLKAWRRGTLGERLFWKLETRFKMRHLATLSAMAGSQDSGSDDKGLADAT